MGVVASQCFRISPLLCRSEFRVSTRYADIVNASDLPFPRVVVSGRLCCLSMMFRVDIQPSLICLAKYARKEHLRCKIRWSTPHKARASHHTEGEPPARENMLNGVRTYIAFSGPHSAVVRGWLPNINLIDFSSTCEVISSP